MSEGGGEERAGEEEISEELDALDVARERVVVERAEGGEGIGTDSRIVVAEEKVDVRNEERLSSGVSA